MAVVSWYYYLIYSDCRIVDVLRLVKQEVPEQNSAIVFPGARGWVDRTKLL